MTLYSSGPPRKTSYLVSITLLSRKAQPHYLLRHLEEETEHGAEPASLAISQPSTKITSSLPSPTLQPSPGDEIDSSVGCAWREELQGEPPVSRVQPSAHLLPQSLMPVSVEDRGGAARTVLGALAAAAAAAIGLGAGAGAAGMLGLVDHGELSGGREQKEHSGYKQDTHLGKGQLLLGWAADGEKEACAKTQH